MSLPSIGRVVMYRSRTGNYTLPAIITATRGTLWQEGVDRGDVSALSFDESVHLHVFTPGAQGSYTEHDVPYAGPTPIVRQGSDPGAWMRPGSWAWPPRFESV